MKRIVNYLIVITLSVSLLSCVEESLPVEDSKETDAVSFIINNFIPETQVKSAFDASTMSFQWSENDVIGIFPSEGFQAVFPLKSGEASNSAIFDGGGWGLKSDAVYYAYYPFSKDNFESEERRSAVGYTYEGQTACFADASGIVDVSGYDFMASGPSVLDGETVTFRFGHLGALCGIRFTAPATAVYKNFYISANEEVFPVTGYFDATAAGTVTLIGDQEKKSLFEVLFPAGRQMFTAGDEVEMYFLMPPVDLSSNSLKFILYDMEDNYYESDITGKKLEAGVSYGWNAGVLAGYDPANCYIISESGTYTIPTVKGNDMLSALSGVNSAELIWESFGTDVAPARGDLIKNVSYDDNTITFTTSDTFTEGNALIAAKDAGGNILWSWHVWLTDKPEDQVYVNNAGTMMDRNLGATSVTPGDIETLGLMYQWGRKDPFMGGGSFSDSGESRAASATVLDWTSTVSYDGYTETVLGGTIDYSIANPTTFIQLCNNNSDWLYSSEYGVTDNTRWQSEKTIYDPCPAGYRVPDGGENGVWAVGLDSGPYGFDLTYDHTDHGIDFGISNQEHSLTEMQSCWYPGAGMLDSYSGEIYNVGYAGLYWSCTPSDHYACCFSVGPYSEPASNSYRSSGYSVRCLKE